MLELPTDSKKIAIVTYENRPKNLVGTKLLLLTLKHHGFDGEIHVFNPNADSDEIAFIIDNGGYIHYENLSFLPNNYNVKPYLLKWALDKGYERAIWIDSDIIVSQQLPEKLLNSPLDHLVVSAHSSGSFVFTEERTKGWGLKLVRRFLRDPSSCCMQVTSAHYNFLNIWIEYLETDTYQQYQRLPMAERPKHAICEDSVLTALLASDVCGDLPVIFLKNGIDIAQCLSPGSYTTLDRLLTLVRGLPPLIHAMGKKPWDTKPKNYYDLLSPYTCVARYFIDFLSDEEKDWLAEPDGVYKNWFDLIRKHPSLSGLPFALRANLANARAKVLFHRIKYFLQGG